MIPVPRDETLALLVIDMQVDDVEPDGVMPAAGAAAIVPRIGRLKAAARAAGWPVVYTQHVHRADLSDFGIAHYFEQPSCVAGTHGMDIIDALRPQDGDIVVQKRRYDAFFATDLDLVLRGLGVTGIFVCGVLTDGCVLSTVAHGRCMDYKIWLARDALAGTTEAKHDSALAVLETYFADIVPSQTLLDAMTR